MIEEYRIQRDELREAVLVQAQDVAIWHTRAEAAEEREKRLLRTLRVAQGCVHDDPQRAYEIISTALAGLAEE